MRIFLEVDFTRPHFFLNVRNRYFFLWVKCVAEGVHFHSRWLNSYRNLRVPPPNPHPLRNSRPCWGNYSPAWSFNKALNGPYFLGRVGPLVPLKIKDSVDFSSLTPTSRIIPGLASSQDHPHLSAMNFHLDRCSTTPGLVDLRYHHG